MMTPFLVVRGLSLLLVPFGEAFFDLTPLGVTIWLSLGNLLPLGDKMLS